MFKSFITVSQLYLLSPHQKRFELASDLIFSTRDGDRYIIPAGYVTDLASIPSIFFWWEWGWYNLAAIPHDFGYHYGSFYRLTEDDEVEEFPISRYYCDLIFYQHMRDLGVSRITAYLMFLAVRWGSKRYWNRCEDACVNIAQIFQETAR